MESAWDFIRHSDVELKEILSEASFDNTRYAEWISERLKERGVKKSQVVRKSRLNQTFAYQIMSGMRRPSRDKLVQLAFGMGLDAECASDMMERGGVNRLLPYVRRDAIIAYCLEQGMDVMACDKLLWRLREKGLFPREGRK